jgi:hypothetical protein
MRRRTWTAAALLAALASLGTAGTARADDAVAKQIFGAVSGGKSFACFARTYEAGHLARHPQQKVTSMTLLVSAEKSDEDGELNYAFQMGLRLRGQKSGAFDTGGGCGHTRVSEGTGGLVRLECGVDCDGGGLTVEVAGQNKPVIVRLESVRISRSAKSGNQEAYRLESADDRVFRLDRVGLRECKSLITDQEELALK